MSRTSQPSFDLILDCDGVLADLVTPSRRELSHFYSLTTHTRVEIEDPRDYYFRDVADEAGLQFLHKLWGREGFASSLLPYPGVKDILPALLEQKLFSVGVVTAPFNSPTWRRDRMEWLQRYGFKEEQIIFSDKKEEVSGFVFIDDKPSNIRDWAAEHPDGIALMPRHPYNEDYVPHFNNIMQIPEVNATSVHQRSLISQYIPEPYATLIYLLASATTLVWRQQAS